MKASRFAVKNETVRDTAVRRLVSLQLSASLATVAAMQKKASEPGENKKVSLLSIFLTTDFGSDVRILRLASFPS